MKIAIPTSELNMVDSHFGHCAGFTVFTIENNAVVNKEVVASGEGCGCKSNIAPILAGMGVTLMLAGSMGEGAVSVLAMNGIQVLRGCSGNIDQVVKDYIDGNLVDDGTCCSHHEGCH